MQIMKVPTNHKLNQMQRKLNWHGDLLTNGKTSRKAKTTPSDFKVTTPKNPLINNQAVISIRNHTNYPNLSQNKNLQLNFCSNTQLDLIL